MKIRLLEMPDVIPVRCKLLDEVGDDYLTLLYKDRDVWAIFGPSELPSGPISSTSVRKNIKRRR